MRAAESREGKKKLKKKKKTQREEKKNKQHSRHPTDRHDTERGSHAAPDTLNRCGKHKKKSIKAPPATKTNAKKREEFSSEARDGKVGI